MKRIIAAFVILLLVFAFVMWPGNDAVQASNLTDDGGIMLDSAGSRTRVEPDDWIKYY